MAVRCLLPPRRSDITADGVGRCELCIGWRPCRYGYSPVYEQAAGFLTSGKSRYLGPAWLCVKSPQQLGNAAAHCDRDGLMSQAEAGTSPIAVGPRAGPVGSLYQTLGLEAQTRTPSALPSRARRDVRVLARERKGDGMTVQPAPVRLVHAYEQVLRDTEADADTSPPIYARFASHWLVRWFVVGHIHRSLAALGGALQRSTLTATPGATNAEVALLREFDAALPEVRHARAVGALIVVIGLIPLAATRKSAPEASLILDTARSVLSLDGVGLAETWRSSDPSMLAWSSVLLCVSVALAGFVPAASFWLKRSAFSRRGVYEIERELAEDVGVRPHQEVGWDLALLGVVAGTIGLFLWLSVLDIMDSIVAATIIGSAVCTGLIALRGCALGRHGVAWTRQHTVTSAVVLAVTAAGLFAVARSTWMESSRRTFITITSAELTESSVAFGEVLDGNYATPAETRPLTSYLESLGRPADQDTLRLLEGVALRYGAQFDGARRCDCFARASVHDAKTREPLTQDWYSSDHKIPMRSHDARTTEDTVWVLAPDAAGEYFVKLEIFVIEPADDPNEVPAGRHVESGEIVFRDGTTEGPFHHALRRLAGADTDSFVVSD